MTLLVMYCEIQNRALLIKSGANKSIDQDDRLTSAYLLSETIDNLMRQQFKIFYLDEVIRIHNSSVLMALGPMLTFWLNMSEDHLISFEKLF